MTANVKLKEDIYTAESIKIGFRDDSPEGRQLCDWLLQIKGGELDGQVVTKTYNVGTKKDMELMDRELSRFGVMTHDRENFESTAYFVLDEMVQIRAVDEDDGEQRLLLCGPTSDDGARAFQEVSIW